MSVEIDSPCASAIRKLTPFNTLSIEHFNALCAEITVERQNAGFALFKRGDTGKDYVYLLEGDVSLQAPEFSIETVSAQEEMVRFPLAHQIPRKIDAVAVSAIRFFRINPERIHVAPEVYYQYREEAGYVVSGEDDSDSDDWMTALLSAPVFQRLPAANLQKILMQLESVQYAPGDTIAQQNDMGAYFYFIRQGECQLTRQHSADGKTAVVAQLGRYESFGEEAILSGLPQQATVTALTAVTVARLSQERFINLVAEPVMQYVDLDAAQRHLQDNTGVLLDVRSQDAYNAAHVGGSQNVPYFSLPMQLKTLNREHKIITLCQDGKLSAAAAYLLLKAGFEPAVCKGGISALPGDVLIGTHAGTGEIEPAATASVSFSEVFDTETLESPQQAFAGMEVQSSALEAENAALREALQSLQAKYETVLVEKQRLEKSFRALLAQAEKMKELLRQAASKQPPGQ